MAKSLEINSTMLATQALKILEEVIPASDRAPHHHQNLYRSFHYRMEKLIFYLPCVASYKPPADSLSSWSSSQLNSRGKRSIQKGRLYICGLWLTTQLLPSSRVTSTLQILFTHIHNFFIKQRNHLTLYMKQPCSKGFHVQGLRHQTSKTKMLPSVTISDGTTLNFCPQES